MRVDEQMYRKVAEHCSSYSMKTKGSAKNKSGDAPVSCTTCKHFASDEHCTLDLFDPIVENHKF
ncbi:MAG: hypothetical protein J5972_06640 [Eubacterium sp.]|nr:hypothetical protein [Eubacterium sp.]